MKRLAAFLAVFVLAGSLGGCTASRNGLGTHDSVCFRVYPQAVAAVRHQGRFAGIRYLPPRTLILDMPGVAVPDELTDAARVATCLVAFKGHFNVSSVEQGWAPEQPVGRIAIVVVRQRDSALVATVVLSRLPPRLVFAHVFPDLR
jgi:hypothetical protein